jgi:hypothetical protein
VMIHRTEDCVRRMSAIVGRTYMGFAISSGRE